MVINTIDVEGLRIRQCAVDLRRDLHTYVDYVRGREVRRKVNGNTLMKSDVKRLAKIMSAPDIMDEYARYEQSIWLSFIDLLAYRLGWIHYDTEGEYRSYRSAEPVFPDNYMICRVERYAADLAQEHNVQEQQLLETLCSLYSYDHNEFFAISPRGWLTPFPGFGIMRSALTTIDFNAVRRLLLQQLSTFPTGVWLSLADWVAQLRATQPYFLIAEHPQIEKQSYGYRRRKEPAYETIPRYLNLHEKPYIYEDVSIPADGFERVEGRYLARFLEYLPFLFGYVDLAYDPDFTPQSIPRYGGLPELEQGALRAFRVTPLLQQTLTHTLPPPTLTIQPNFEVVVESTIYPVQLLTKLARLGSLTQRGRMSTLKLEKQAVAAAVARADAWDVVGWLEEQASREMPQNVRIELVEWVKRADTFTLYPDLDLVEDYLGLDAVAEVATHSVNEYLFLVPERMQIADTLRAGGQVVLNILHSHDQVAPVPESSVFVQPPPEPDEPETLVVQQTTAITLTFPHVDGLRVVRQRLLDARCPVMSNEQAQSLTFPAGYQAVLAQVIADVAAHYQITLVEESS